MKQFRCQNCGRGLNFEQVVMQFPCLCQKCFNKHIRPLYKFDGVQGWMRKKWKLEKGAN